MKKFILSVLPFLSACSADPPIDLGVQENRLAPCPKSPNCVSSFDSDNSHTIRPLNADLEKIERMLASLSHANIVDRSGNYMRVEFTSRILRYIDDVEFLHDENGGVTHIRSASRVGFTDLGVNRKRVEKIRSLVE